MALRTPPLVPLLSLSRHRVSSPSFLAAGAFPSPLICLFPHSHRHHDALCPSGPNVWPLHRRSRRRAAASLDQEESSASETTVAPEEDPGPPVSSDAAEASPEDLESIREIKRVLELLKKNRDMTFGELAILGLTDKGLILRLCAELIYAKIKVKLTIMIEDPRDIERKRTLGIEDPDEITRDDLADALAEVNEGKIPENRVALQLLAKEMSEWPDIEIEAPKKKSKPGKSVYAKATDTGIDPETAAKRLNLDWDSAADIGDEEEDDDETEVPSAVGYGALYLLTAFPVIIGISVVLILFYNSLQ